MLELLKFALETPANFFGTLTFLMVFYAMFGGSTLTAFKEFMAYRKTTAELNAAVEREQLAVRKLEAANWEKEFAALNKS